MNTAKNSIESENSIANRIELSSDITTMEASSIAASAAIELEASTAAAGRATVTVSDREIQKILFESTVNPEISSKKRNVELVSTKSDHNITVKSNVVKLSHGLSNQDENKAFLDIADNADCNLTASDLHNDEV